MPGQEVDTEKSRAENVREKSIGTVAHVPLDPASVPGVERVSHN